jgi:hypothetical protein
LRLAEVNPESAEHWAVKSTQGPLDAASNIKARNTSPRPIRDIFDATFLEKPQRRPKRIETQLSAIAVIPRAKPSRERIKTYFKAVLLSGRSRPSVASG